MFHEQAVYERGTKMKKGLLNESRSYSYVALPFPGRVRDGISIAQRTEAKRGWK